MVATARRPHRAAVVAVSIAILLAACTASPELATDTAPMPDRLSMSREALDRMRLAPGSHVVAPTDSALMGLDAGILARAAADGGVDFILEDLVLAEPIDPETLAEPTTVRTTTGVDVDFVPTEDGVVVGQGRLVEVRREGDLTMIVVEGLWDR